MAEGLKRRTHLLSGLRALGILTVAALTAAAASEKAVLLLMKARAAESARQSGQALELASQAIETDPNYPRAYLFRGALHDAAERHAEALADYDQVIRLEPQAADHYNLRGSTLFKLGRFEHAIADFDQAVELEPRYGPNHWQRGLAYFYAGRYEEGANQFEQCDAASPNDVENAVWRYLCQARLAGVEKARASLLKVSNDARVPMMEVYALFGGAATVEDVLKAAEAEAPSQARQWRLFHGRLYAGLYYDAHSDAEAAREHITRAVEQHKIDHFMWDIGRLHLERLRGSAPPN